MKTFCHNFSLIFFLKMRNIQIESAGKIKTRFMFNNFFLENCAVCEIMYKNIIEPDRLQMTI